MATTLEISSASESRPELAPIRVERLEISYFRRFEKLEISFPKEGPVVFVGVNGAGKSTILEAIQLSLSWFTKRLEGALTRGRYPSESEINSESSWCFIRIQVQIGAKSIRWGVGKSKKGFELDYPNDTQQLGELTKSWRQANLKPEGIPDMPIVFYYQVDRSITDIPSRVRKSKLKDSFSTYYRGKDGRSLDFREFFYWFKEQQNIELQEKNNRRNAQLDLVRKAITEIVPSFSNPRVINRRNKFVVDQDVNGKVKEVFIDQMSDGERTLFTLVADIARRGALALNEREGIELEDVFGIVLIDEIELHLHPTWQSTIMARLQATFPCVQFIVTTHSPAILTNIKNENSMSLKGGKLFSPISYGRTSDALLEQVFESPISAAEIELIFKDIDAAINNGDNKIAKQKLEELRLLVPDDERLAAAEIALWSPKI